MKKIGYKLAIILIVAIAIKWPWELSLQSSHRNLNLGDSSLSVELRSKLTQNFAVALLSGFRGIVADFIWYDAHCAWMDQVWYKLKEGIELAVVLQPHSIPFWDIGSWHMAWNASYGESVNPKYPSQAYRTKMARDWIQAGKQFLEMGIRNNPDDYHLYFAQGWLIDQKLKDPMKAAPFFIKASSYPQAPLYVRRLVGHMYEKAGETRLAYEWWKKLWMEDHSKYPENVMMWSKIAMWGAQNEELLNIPPAERVFPSKAKPLRVDVSK